MQGSSAYLLHWMSSPWVIRKCLLGPGSGTKQPLWGERLGMKDLWDPQEMRAEGQGRMPRVFCCRDRDEMGDWV